MRWWWPVGGVGAILAAGALAVAAVRPPQPSLPARADAVVVFAGDDSRIRGALDLVPARAPVLVVSSADGADVAGLRCGQQEPYEVLCVNPHEATTRGEAEMFARIAEDRGWSHLVGVTSQDHLRRARWHLRRCWDGELSVAARGSNRPLSTALPYEVAGLAKAVILERGCR